MFGPPLCHLDQWLIFYWPKNIFSGQPKAGHHSRHCKWWQKLTLTLARWPKKKRGGGGSGIWNGHNFATNEGLQFLFLWVLIDNLINKKYISFNIDGYCPGISSPLQHNVYKKYIHVYLSSTKSLLFKWRRLFVIR